MPCKIEIRKKIESSVEQLTESTTALNLKSANEVAKEVNDSFGVKVVEFVMVGDVIDKSISIPESLIQTYFDSELEMEKQEAARLLKEEEEKKRKYVESKKEEWEENREYFENDEPFTKASDANTQDSFFQIKNIFNSLLEVETSLKSQNKTAKSIGSDKNIDKILKKAGLDVERRQQFLQLLKDNPSLKSLKLSEVLSSYLKEFVKESDRQYYKAIDEPLSKELENILIDYFDKFHIRKKELDNLKEKFGVDSVGVFDVLAKTIYYAKNRNILTLPEEYGHVFVELLGSISNKKANNPLFKYMFNNIDKWDGYQRVLNDYKNVYVTAEGNIDIYKIKKEAIGQAIGIALVRNYKNNKAADKNLWDKIFNKDSDFWTKVQEIIDYLYSILGDMDYVNINLEADKIAKDILSKNYSKLDRLKKDTSNYNLLSYSETIKNQNKIDGGKALKFMQWFSEKGMIITGSLAYRLQGTVFRPELDALHDIDNIVPSDVHGVKLELENFLTPEQLEQNKLYRKLIAEGKYKEAKQYKIKGNIRLNIEEQVEKIQVLQDLKKEFPETEFLYSFYNQKANAYYVTINAIWSENQELKDRFKSYTGSFNERLENFTKEELEQIYLFDFFLRPEVTEDYKKIEDKEFGLSLAHFNYSFYEKLNMMGRPKDAYDYQMWDYFDEDNILPPEFNDRMVYYQMNNKKDKVNKNIKVYQGITNNADNREFNYLTTNRNEALDYGSNVREIELNPSNFLVKREKNGEWSKSFEKLHKEFKNLGNETFDILDNSKEGLKNQNKFFSFLKEKGYEGYAEKPSVLRGEVTGENDYLITFTTPKELPTKLNSITPKVNIVNYRTMDDKSKEDAMNGVEEAQKRWVEEEIAEFYEAVDQYTKGLDTFSSKGVNKGKATIDDVIDETLGIFRTIQMFPKFSDAILPYLNDIKTALNTFGRKEGYAIYKAKKDAKGQAKEMTYENLFEVVDKFIKPNTEVKPGVKELFDSNPELASAVYEALGFKNFDNKERRVLMTYVSGEVGRKAALQHSYQPDPSEEIHAEKNKDGNWDAVIYRDPNKPFSNEMFERQRKNPISVKENFTYEGFKIVVWSDGMGELSFKDGESEGEVIEQSKEIEHLLTLAESLKRDNVKNFEDASKVEEVKDSYKKSTIVFGTELKGSTSEKSATTLWDLFKKAIVKQDKSFTIFDFLELSEQEGGNLKDYLIKNYGELLSSSDITKVEQLKVTPKEIKIERIPIKQKDNSSTITPQQKEQALQQYSQYLDTIFPDSKVKDIVYHGTNKTFDTFKKEFNNGFGFFVTKNKDYGKVYGSNVKSILINSKNILNIYRLGRENIKEEDINLFNKFQNFLQNNEGRGYNLNQFNDRDISVNNKVISLTNRPFLYEFYKKEGYDSLLGSDEYVVFEPEQIHILGGKQDIEGFKEFVGESTQTVKSYRAQEQAELSQRIPNIENYKIDGKVVKSLITDENDLKTYNEIYDKYDALITPLLEASEETKEQTEVEKAVEELRKKVESIAPVNVPVVKVVEDEEGNIEPVDTKPAQKKISKKTYEDVLAKMKDIVKILGIKVEFTDLGPDIMAKADMFNRLIQFSNDTSSEHNFTEEVLHFVIDILEQKEPQIFNKLMSEIWKYSIYKDVKDAYSNEPKFQTPEGNPDIRLLKKEAVGQLLTAYVLDIEEIKDDKNFIGSIWDTISKVIKSLFYNIPFNKRSEFEELASDILNKNLITPEDAKYIGNSREEFYAKKGSKITSAILANKKKLGKKTDIEYSFSDSKAMYDHFINLNNSTTREIFKEINPTTGLEEEVEYYISNGKKRQRVSSIISESNKGLFKNISQDDVAKALREAKMQKGTEVHQVQEDISRRFIDPATGLLRDTPEPRPENYPFDVKFYNILEDNVEKRLKSYPVGTRFLVETKIINEEFGYGGTMDFLAILPNMDVELLDWKTTDVSYWEGGVKRNRFDISPFNQSYWRSQLSLYSRALQENGVKNIKLARAIPIAVELKQKVLDNKKSKTDPANLYYELVNLNIGDINPKKIKTDEFYLIPVSVAQEVTGVKELDEILNKLIGLKDRVQSTRYKETELYKKKLELDRINSAIREIQGKQQITIFSTLFNENFKRYKTLSTKEFDFLDSLEKGQKFLSKAQEEELHAYFNDVYSAIEFLDTFKNINALVVSLSENGLLEEYTDQVKQNILKLSANAGAVKNLIEERSTEIVDKLAIIYDIESFSSADIVGSYGMTNFVSILHRTEKSVALTGRILNVIKYLEAEEKKKYFDRENGEFAKTFKGVIQWAKKNKSSMKNAYSKLFDKEKEKLISKYSDKFKEELEAKNEEFSKILEELKQNAVAMGYKGVDYTNKINEYFNYTKQWLEDSFDLKKYEEDFIKAFNSQKEWIDKQTWNEDFLLNEEFKGKKIREWVENHNIFTSPKALSSSNFLLYNSMKDKWLSDEYKELQKDSNKELLAAYNLFISLNERARKSGMLDNMYSYRTFKPLIYEPTLGKTTLTAIQKLGLEGWYALKYISDFIKKRIGFVLDDNVYDTNYDPLTKRAIKKIPVRFKQVDEKNMDYVSDDLFSLYQRWASHIINYELLSNFENRFKMIQLIESNRSSELAIDSKGNLSKEKDVNGMTIKNKNKVVAKDRNNQTDIDLNKYINNYLYSTNLDAKPEYYKLGLSLIDYAQSLFLNLNFSSPILNVVGGSILSRLNQGNWFSKNDLTSIALPLVLGTINKKLSPFGDDLIGKASYLITEFNTNITSEYDSPDLNFYKTKGKQSAKKLLNAPLTIGDHLMQNALSIAVFLNTAVVDGELVNINDYVGAKYLPTVYNTQLSYKERNKASNKMKEEINKMKKTKSLLAITKKNGKSYSIEGFNSSQTTYDLNKLNYGNIIHSFIKESIGNYDEYDKSLVNINFYFRFVMQMKKWMPRVIGSRIHGFEQNYELGGGNYGRSRIFFKTLFQAFPVFLQATASSLLQQLPYLNSPNKSFIDYAKEVYKQKQTDFKDKGKELKTTEAEFVKLYTEGFKNQINEFTIIATTLYAMSLIAAAVANDPDKWYWKLIAKLAFKLKRELTFSYDPEQAISLLQNNLFPALGALASLYSAIVETGQEGKGHIQKLIPGYEEIGQENIDAAKPLSKIIRAIPVGRELHYWMSVLDPELPFIHESYLDFMGTEAPKSSF